jgi:hypothetical protein
LKGADERHEALAMLVATLREAGVPHYEGPVPGWDPAQVVKMNVAPSAPEAPAVAGEAKPVVARARQPRTTYTQDELDAALNGHVAIHGEKAAG